ncbi:hypothetical protein [Psychromonas sp. MME2]
MKFKQTLTSLTVASTLLATTQVYAALIDIELVNLTKLNGIHPRINCST